MRRNVLEKKEIGVNQDVSQDVNRDAVMVAVVVTTMAVADKSC